MIVKKLIYILFSGVLILSGCKTEDLLTPSNIDKDRIGEFVASSDKAFVHTIYNSYQCGLLYEFDPILDFTYTAENAVEARTWENIELKQAKEHFLNAEGVMTADSLLKYNAYIDEALTFIDTTLFQFIGHEGKIATHMPFKVLLCNSVFANNSVANSILTESDSRTGSSATNSLNCVYNDHSIVLNINKDALRFNADKYRKDNFYIFLCRIMEMNKLYAEIPEEFSTSSSFYFGKSIQTVYAADKGIALDSVPDIIDKAWFHSKGFVDARYFYNRPTGLTTIDGIPKVIKNSYYFISDQKSDVRSYLNEMIHRNATDFVAYPQEIKDKILLLIHTFKTWGVDITAFNPDLKVLL